jgi:hypothetical protein
MAKRAVFLVLIAFIGIAALFGQDKPFAFVAVGDTGCGCSAQDRVAAKMQSWHSEHPFSTVLLLGDNIYGSVFGTRGGNRALFSERFDKQFKPLMDSGVRFFATLGNHDMETRAGADEVADKKRFNIQGAEGYYSFYSDARVDGKALVQFISLNSVNMIERDASDRTQITWLSKALTEGNAVWKVVYFHHPLYAPSGEGHEPEVGMRRDLEDIFVAAGVQLVLAGHNHYYARMKTQRGITHFVSGGGGRSLKTPEVNPFTERLAEIYHFIYFEVYPDKMTFQVVPAEGKFTDSGTIYPTPPGGNPPAAATSR